MNGLASNSDDDVIVFEDIHQTASDDNSELTLAPRHDDIPCEYPAGSVSYESWSYPPIDVGYYLPDINLSQNEIHLFVGESQRIYLCVDGDIQPFWTESYYVQCGYTQSVTIDGYGWIAGNEPGQCEVCWIIDGIQYVCSVCVEKYIDVAITGPAYVETGSTYSVSAYDKISGNYIDVNWSTDRWDCITLHQDGTFYAFETGNVNICAYESCSGEFLAQYSFYVNPRYYEPEPEEVIYNGPFVLPEDEPGCIPYELNYEFGFNCDY